LDDKKEIDPMMISMSPQIAFVPFPIKFSIFSTSVTPETIEK
jgi:hypothetical protein